MNYGLLALNEYNNNVILSPDGRSEIIPLKLGRGDIIVCSEVKSLLRGLIPAPPALAHSEIRVKQLEPGLKIAFWCKINIETLMRHRLRRFQAGRDTSFNQDIWLFRGCPVVEEAV